MKDIDEMDLGDLCGADLLSELRTIMGAYSMVRGIRVCNESLDLMLVYILDKATTSKGEDGKLDIYLRDELNYISFQIYLHKYYNKMVEVYGIGKIPTSEAKRMAELLENGAEDMREEYKKRFDEDLWDFTKEIQRDDEMEKKRVSDSVELDVEIKETIDRYIR